MKPDEQRAIDALFDRWENALERELGEAATLEEADRIIARYTAPFECLFERWVKRAQRRGGTVAAEKVRAEIEPVRAMIEKRMKDRLWPH